MFSHRANALAFFLLSALLLVGCAQYKTLTFAKESSLEAATKSFSDIVASSSGSLQLEIRDKPRVRRGEALELFLNDPTNEQNFTLGGDKRAFARYVCAGTGALQKEKAFLDFAKTYASGAQGIVKPGGDSFAEQWKKFRELEQPVGDMNSEGKDAPGQTSYDKCVVELVGTDTAAGLLAFKGLPASDTSDEIAPLAIPAALEAFQALFSALQKAATDGLKAVNAVEARRKFTAYVVQMHEQFQGSLSSDLSSDRIRDAWIRRKAYALWAPYLTFTRILGLKKRNASNYQIKELAVKLEAELGEYDAIRATDPPDRIVKALSSAEQAVYEAAESNKVSLNAVVDFLTALAADVNGLKADYTDVDKKASAVISASADVIK
jgi:hypothetical protein